MSKVTVENGVEHSPDNGVGYGAESERYTAYSYSYPHKTSYRTLVEPVPLKKVWEKERKESLFLYVHIPFCEMRCGFCNLFTTTNPGATLESDYLDALERQARRLKDNLGSFGFARLAIGGGTPTYLSAHELERLFDLVERQLAAEPSKIPCSIETSPFTSQPEKLSLLKERGVERVSIGIQSFIEKEVMAVGRSQTASSAQAALDAIRRFDFKTLNIDLMYGLPGQTEESWRFSLEKALAFQPQEIYLYPLYVRPLTGLYRLGEGRVAATGTATDSEESDLRIRLYRQARETLLNAGYEQGSMRMFQSIKRGDDAVPVYCCQNDGMIGIGCGARSYSSALHYSTRYAVEKRPVRQIIEQYTAASVEHFDFADYGIYLDSDEAKRRFIIQSLLQIEGLSLAGYANKFASNALEEFTQLFDKLLAYGYLYEAGNFLRLTEEGLEWSDRVGYEFYSPTVKSLSESYDAR